MRIVSLLPSATEILFAVGAGDHVVGVTFECDYPAGARRRRIVSTSMLPEGLTPQQIDQHVSERMAAGEDLYHLDEGALRDLDADLVVTQDLCAVCAVDVSVVDDALAYLGCRADVLTLDPQTLDDVLATITEVGERVGKPAPAHQLVDSLHSRLKTVAQAVEGRERPRAIVLEWTDPPFAPGHWVPEMVTRAGGENVLGQAGKRSERTTWAAVRDERPAVVVGAPCGYDLAGSAKLTEAIKHELPGTAELWAVDANASFARPGPRLVDGIEALAAILHPGAGIPENPHLAQRISA
ncbi:cobalamin-binding protein [Tenggerimyces flavus]|uniref:Cobalamin-binding protein n=1 Tax=Tenggerimyces flavus TaxID=1708749 RepID=A0ABV7YIR1_9ACTN|nr:cobalamin-binding protein [Tenggerimyces flavus]MBM7784028.1 iron complex transport system substrate-binding protein [Tenggerimyces flavus]